MIDGYKKKICIVGYSPRKIAPYLQRYLFVLDKMGCDFEYITREIADEPLDSIIEDNQYVIKYAKTRNPLRKIFQIIEWKREVKDILKKNKYDRIIILTVYPAVILGSFLYKQCRNRYFVDIRDYVNILRNTILNRRLKSVINGAQFTVVSSKGFLAWMPSKERVCAIHNIQDIDMNCKIAEDISNKEKIVIGYLGVIAYVDTNLKLIMDLAQNSRYSLLYAGIYRDNGCLKGFCEKERIANVVLKGEFENTGRFELYKEVDIINAIYGNDSIVVRSALPNKLYDSAIYKKPILVSSGTYLASIVRKFHLGVAIDINSDIAGQIDDYISHFCLKDFIDGAEKFLSICSEEEKETLGKIESFLVD